MYCPNCKKEAGTDDYCPWCGRKLSEKRLIDNSRSTSGEHGTYLKNKTKINYSKPLCLVFALVLLFTMILPWVRIAVPQAEVELSMSVFSIQPRFSEYSDLAIMYAPLAGIDIQPYEDIIWLTNGILLIVTAFFMLTALNFILFGIIGVFSNGRARYFFARVGCVLYIIGLCLFIASILVGNSYLKTSLGDSLSTYGVEVSLSLTLWPFVALVLTILFRTLGIRALRYFNGISCMSRGYNDVAERELGKINKLKYIKMANQEHSKRRYAYMQEDD